MGIDVHGKIVMRKKPEDKKEVKGIGEEKSLSSRELGMDFLSSVSLNGFNF